MDVVSDMGRSVGRGMTELVFLQFMVFLHHVPYPGPASVSAKGISSIMMIYTYVVKLL